MKRISCLVALLCFAAPSVAQSTPPSQSPVARATVGAPQRYTLDYATGTLTKVDASDDEQIGVNTTATIAYDNTCTLGSFTAIFPGFEFFDWGTKSAALTNIVRSFEFAYSTGELDTAFGGAGAGIDISFYSGSLGFGDPGTEVARFSFTGLPGTNAIGGLSTFFVSVDLTGGSEFCLPDGDIGYAYCSFDVAGTGPLLGVISSCQNGQDDFFDIYSCPLDALSYGGSFSFGGTPSATFYMRIDEDDGSQLATVVEDHGAAGNLNILSSAGVAPVFGTTWPMFYFDAEGFTRNGPGGGVSTALWFSGRLPAGALVTVFGEILIDPTSALIFTDTVAISADIADHPIPIPPKSLDLLDLGTVYIQAFRVGGGAPLRLSTLIETVFGF